VPCTIRLGADHDAFARPEDFIAATAFALVIIVRAAGPESKRLRSTLSGAHVEPPGCLAAPVVLAWTGSRLSKSPARSDMPQFGCLIS
jgi:hypothetical protein